MATRWITTREGDMEPITTKARLLPRGGADGKRWQYQTERDERLFEAAWFADFRQQFRNALTDARINGRLNSLEV
jgi:hypothetical protein